MGGKSRDPTTIGWYTPPLRALLPPFRQRAFIQSTPDTTNGTTLLISGAGFSAAWGLPLTSEIPTEIQLSRAGNPMVEYQMFKPVRDLVAYVQAKQGDQFDFEEFTTWIVETGMADDVSWWDKLGFPKGDQPREDAEFFYRMLTWMFGYILLKNDPESEMMGPPPDWRRPTAYVQLERDFGRLSGIVTLNYDVLPEHLFADRGIDYGFGRKDLLVASSFKPMTVDTAEMTRRNLAALGDAGLGRDELEEIRTYLSEQYCHKVYADHRFVAGNFPVLKIHGGMNLVHCPACQRAIVLPPWLRRVDKAQWDFPGYEFGWSRSGGHQAAFHCKDATGNLPPNMEPHRLQPMSIPPVRSKEKLPEWPLMAPVHERALQLAEAAERVVIVGTSVRPADQALWQILDRVETDDVLYIGGPNGLQRLQTLIPKAVCPRPTL